MFRPGIKNHRSKNFPKTTPKNPKFGQSLTKVESQLSSLSGCKMIAYTHENLYEIGDVFAVRNGDNYHYFTLVSYDENNWVSVKLNEDIYQARREIEMVGDDCGFTGNLKIHLGNECVLAIPSYAVGIRA